MNQGGSAGSLNRIGIPVNEAMKKIFALLVAAMMVVFVTACGDTNTGKEETEQKVETAEPAPETKPSGIQDDGMGDDPSFGEGIGEVVALSDEEKGYVAAQTTKTWLEMSREKKDDLVVLIGRWLEDSSGFIVKDYDDLVVMLDRQMEQYSKNSVDESVLATVCDISGAAMPADVPGRAG